MSLSDRLHQLAVRGCLIVGLVLLTAGVGPCEGQESTHESTPEGSSAVQSGQRVAVQTPATGSGGSDATNRQHTPAATHPTESALHEQAGSEPACGPRCQDAIQREKDDLDAQRTMAAYTRDMAISSDEMAYLTLWQAIIGGFGLAALVATISLSIRATNAAIEANIIARENAHADMRAYLLIEGITISKFTKNNPASIVIHVKNYGNTPAMSIEATSYRGVIVRPAAHFPLDDSRPRIISSLGRDQSFFHTLQFTEKTWPLIYGMLNLEGRDLHCYGIIKYEDVFGVAHQTTFRYWMPFVMDGLNECHFIPCQDGNRVDRNKPPESEHQRPLGNMVRSAASAVVRRLTGRAAA